MFYKLEATKFAGMDLTGKTSALSFEHQLEFVCMCVIVTGIRITSTSPSGKRLFSSHQCLPTKSHINIWMASPQVG